MLKNIIEKWKVAMERRRLRRARERVFQELDQIYQLRKYFDTREPKLITRANDIATRELNISVPGRATRSR
jgi:hypothetical protein